MKSKTIILTTAVIALSCAVLSCASIASAASFGAQVAGATGAINPNVAHAISNSSKAIGSAAEEINPEQEYYIGRAVAANILSSYKLWTGSPALTAYLNNICAAITINSPRPNIYNGYHVAILDSNEINAFATSGGHILVTRGLINTAKSEDALAGVIAHEIAHIQLQHSIKSIKTSRITQALLVTGTSAVGAAAGMDVNQLTDVFNESVGEIVQTMVNNGYSQGQEYDADKTALSLMATAGYNPQGLIDMLKELNAIQSKTDGGFNKTHPSPAQRISNAEKSIGKYKTADTRADRQARFAVTN
ncbi:MAG: M48 family metalloprotease [Treponema sp.]|jgi:predicted Zn-dependent protease|nr:M48 family metalloprotease [Treponema sp.]